MKLKIGFVYDLRNDYIAEGFTVEQAAEFDSEETVRLLDDAILSLGYEVDRIGNGRALCRRLVAGDRWDLVFNVAEGMNGRSREAQVPCLLEMYSIPYTFSDPLVCAMTLDKAMAKRLVGAAGLNTPRFHLVEDKSDLTRINLTYPLFAKPVAEGTGKGVDGSSKITSQDELRSVSSRLLEQFKQPVLVEEYLPGREFTTGILGTGKDAHVLGTMEVRIKKGAPTVDYSYEVKELCEKFVEYMPMEKGALRKDVEKLALAAYRVLECRDAGRADIRLDGNNSPSFMEINPLPGLHPTHSDLPMIATQEGMSYNELIGSIINSAANRHGLRDARTI
jgi:D-alanine-D-alanine ligase